MPPPLIILISSCFMALAMSVVLLVIARTFPKNIRGLREWGVSVLVIALAIPLFVARDTIPDLFSIIVAQLMLLLGFMLMNAGTRKFAGVAPRDNAVQLFGFVLAYVALFAWFTYVQPSVAMRLAALSGVTRDGRQEQLVLGMTLKAALARAGLVEAFEGRDGGYRLTRCAADISLAEVYLALAREPLLPPNPAAANPRCPISVAMGPALAEIAADAEARFREALAKRTLADVADGLDVLVR